MNRESLELIKVQIARAMRGEPMPSMAVEEFQETLDAINALLEVQAADAKKIFLANLGNWTLGLLNKQLGASLEAERELSKMIDRGNKLC